MPKGFGQVFVSPGCDSLAVCRIGQYRKVLGDSPQRSSERADQCRRKGL